MMKCEHGQCTCIASEGRFCSDHCQRAVEMPNAAYTGLGGAGTTDCGCGHSECMGGAAPLT
jgi:hypothetical protein